MNLKTHTIVLLFGMALMYFLMSNCEDKRKPTTIYKTKEIKGEIPPAEAYTSVFLFGRLKQIVIFVIQS